MILLVIFFKSRNGVYPLTSYDSTGQNPIPVSSISNQDLRAQSPEQKNLEGANTDAVASSSTQSVDKEMRRVINMMCNIKPKENNGETELTVGVIFWKF